MKLLTIIEQGYEELECIGACALLLRGGVEVDIYTVDNTEATGRFGLTLAHLNDLKNVDIKQYDGVLIPGGPHYKKIEVNERVKEIVDYFWTNDKVVAAICAAPTVLGKWGYLKGKNYTCFTSMNADFGGTYIDEYAVVDGKLVTGRSAAATIDFGFALLEVLCGKEHSEKIKKEIYY
ncbi:MAG: DJ-1/PfpI family protein [Erysipelotrichales bacterium]|nr:DJ-1/PfpI family protein [Erysipelotrichales bacterium]